MQGGGIVIRCRDSWRSLNFLEYKASLIDVEQFEIRWVRKGYRGGRPGFSKSKNYRET